MKLQDLERHYKVLSEIHDRFRTGERQIERGVDENEKVIADREMATALLLSDNYIGMNEELYNMITGGESDAISDYSRESQYEEFKSRQYFGRDMTNFLDDLKSSIREKKGTD